MFKLGKLSSGLWRVVLFVLICFILGFFKNLFYILYSYGIYVSVNLILIIFMVK